MTSTLSTSPSDASTPIPTFTVWVDTRWGTRRYENVTEAAEYPDRVRVQHEYPEETRGDIVRVRQTELEASGPKPGHRLILYPEGEVRDVVDAIRLPTGMVRAADATGEQHDNEGRVIWLKPY